MNTWPPYCYIIPIDDGDEEEEDGVTQQLLPQQFPQRALPPDDDDNKDEDDIDDDDANDDLYIMPTRSFSVCMFIKFGFTMNVEFPITTVNHL